METTVKKLLHEVGNSAKGLKLREIGYNYKNL